MIVVSTFNRSQKAAIRKGFNDDIDTYLIISGRAFLVIKRHTKLIYAVKLKECGRHLCTWATLWDPLCPDS